MSSSRGSDRGTLLVSAQLTRSAAVRSNPVPLTSAMPLQAAAQQGQPGQVCSIFTLSSHVLTHAHFLFWLTERLIAYSRRSIPAHSISASRLAPIWFCNAPHRRHGPCRRQSLHSCFRLAASLLFARQSVISLQCQVGCHVKNVRWMTICRESLVRCRPLRLLLAACCCLVVLSAHHASAALSRRHSSTAFDLPAIKSDLALLMASPAAGADGSLAPFFVMLAWHSAASYSALTQQGGTDGANIRFPPESLWPQNRPIAPALLSLHQLALRHGNISLADVITLAGVVAVEQVRGPSTQWRPGRTDSSHSPLPPNLASRIPSPRSSAATLGHAFASLSLSAREMVALTGAHTLGRCHRTLSGYDGQWTHRPLRFTADFFRLLSSETWRPRRWDGPLQYENVRLTEDGREVSGGLMMLPSDLALLERNETREWVERYASDERLLFEDFSAAYGKLLELGVRFHK